MTVVNQAVEMLKFVPSKQYSSAAEYRFQSVECYSQLHASSYVLRVCNSPQRVIGTKYGHNYTFIYKGKCIFIVCLSQNQHTSCFTFKWYCDVKILVLVVPSYSIICGYETLNKMFLFSHHVDARVSVYRPVSLFIVLLENRPLKSGVRN